MQSLKILPGLSLVIDMRQIDADALSEQIEYCAFCGAGMRKGGAE